MLKRFVVADTNLFHTWIMQDCSLHIWIHNTVHPPSFEIPSSLHLVQSEWKWSNSIVLYSTCSKFISAKQYATYWKISTSSGPIPHDKIFHYPRNIYQPQIAKPSHVVTMEFSARNLIPKRTIQRQNQLKGFKEYEHIVFTFEWLSCWLHACRVAGIKRKSILAIPGESPLPMFIHDLPGLKG